MEILFLILLLAFSLPFIGLLICEAFLERQGRSDRQSRIVVTTPRERKRIRGIAESFWIANAMKNRFKPTSQVKIPSLAEKEIFE
jgi:hypothetical protein